MLARIIADLHKGRGIIVRLVAMMPLIVTTQNTLIEFWPNLMASRRLSIAQTERMTASTNGNDGLAR